MENWKILALASAFFASLTAIFAKIGVSDIDSNLATFIRTIVILIFISVLLFATDFRLGSLKTLNTKQLVCLAASGICTGLSWLFYFRALKFGQASKVAPLDKLSLALTIVLAAIILGEKITLKLAIGALLIVLGTVVVVL